MPESFGGLERVANCEWPTWRSAFRAETPITLPSGLAIRLGDFVVELRNGAAKWPIRPFRVTPVRVPRGDYLALAEATDALLPVWWGSRSPTPAFISYLRNRITKRGRDDTSPIVVVRPLRSGVSEAIEATNDDAAIFELLSRVGGLMPKEEKAGNG